jgi:hypothetical protein
MSKNKRREAIRAKKRVQKMKSNLIWGAIAVSVVALIGFLAWRASRPSVGESIPVMTNSNNHIPAGTDPGPYNSNPPTSGSHYGQEYDAGFYDQNSPEAQAPYPEGYLGHNLEHGYVIYWYNCDLLDELGCDQLKAQIQSSMTKNRSTKLIAFPSSSIDVPVVMTSWGQLQRFESFDEDLANKFVSINRNRAPEPDAP